MSPEYVYHDRHMIQVNTTCENHQPYIICTSDDVLLKTLSACALSKYVDIHYVVCFLKSNLK